jgi:hypothetical protein
LELTRVLSFPGIKGRETNIANLKVIIVRATDADGNRSWVIANGKTDPPSPLFLRW